MAASAFRLVEAVEVAVRNGLNDALVTKYGDDWWRPDRPPPILKGESRKNAEKELHRREKNGATLSTGKFVSEMTFGFWYALTTTAYDGQWRAALHTAFFGTPPARKQVMRDLYRLKELRNRAAHHEIVWSRDLARDRTAAVRVLRALHPHLARWAQPRLDGFDRAMEERPAWTSPGVI